jgi:hypothetical protein
MRSTRRTLWAIIVITLLLGAAVATRAIGQWPPAAAQSGPRQPTTPVATAILPPVNLPLLSALADLQPPNATAVPTSAAASVTPPPSLTPTPGPTVPHTPGVPACDETRGDAGGFRFSRDGGVTLAPNATRLPNLAYTWDLDVDPRDPDVILELHEHTLFRSADAGCTFAVLATFERSWTELTRAPSDPMVLVLTSFLGSGDAGSLLWSADAGVTWQAEPLPEDALAFAIAPNDPWQWAFVGRTPALYLRTGRDTRWEARPITGLPGGSASITSAASAPSQWGRWLVGSMVDGLHRTDDNGTTWQPASVGLGGMVGEPPEPVTAQVVAWVAIAPSDADVAYIVVNRVGRDQSQRAIYRSGDGAATWQPRVVDGQPVGDRKADLTGGTRVFVSPDDPDTVLFPFGLSFGGYGTDLFRSRDGLAKLDVSHFDGFYEVMALGFGPTGTELRYLGTSSDIPR